LTWALTEAFLSTSISGKYPCVAPQVITSSFPIAEEKYVRTDHKYSLQFLNGFSPYTQDNKTETIKSLVLEWKNKLVIEFDCSMIT